MLKILFHFYNLLLIILYIYPGSILGFLIYKDLSHQPQITSDFFSISSNHLYVFIILSLLGLLSIKKNLLLFSYLIFISIFASKLEPIILSALLLSILMFASSLINLILSHLLFISSFFH